MKCEKCDHVIQIGEWPFCNGDPKDHGFPRGMQTFTPYWDEHISDDGKPVYITSWQQRQNLLKKHWWKDHEVHTVERGEISKRNWRR